MSGTPIFLAATPEAASRDLLSEMLRTVRLTGSVFLDGRFSAPFAVISPRQFDEGTPMAHLRHVSVFHLIASGGCAVELASGERHSVSAGDILLMPFPDEHRFTSGNGAPAAHADDLVRPSPVNGIWRIDHGGGGEVTRMVCGFIESSELLFAPVFRSLPPILIDRPADDSVGAVIGSTVRQIFELAAAAVPGSELVLGRLMEVLFIEMLRRYAAGLPPGARGWFAALNDPVVSRALAAVHGDPARRWTVEDLAREAAVSRTVLADRFRAVMGQTPIDYVASWRMQLAASRLRGGESLAAVAAGVGYESEAAFSRAFKRLTGVTPGHWRKGAPPEGLTAAPA